LSHVLSIRNQVRVEQAMQRKVGGDTREVLWTKCLNMLAAQQRGWKQ
jgi:hypothetical protein